MTMTVALPLVTRDEEKTMFLRSPRARFSAVWIVSAVFSTGSDSPVSALSLVINE